ncbi:myeloid leukemia factor 1 [Canna indica]|uniref:Myeloid leukemia factor 1 n=1 Tax=Canna indica TaxID=4628 RepID=A0AAQ3Q1W7_9LILI|nr:myeloid leukemia factor 1 [Canna indica]
MFGPSMPNWCTFGETSNAGFLGQAPPKDRSRRPIIEELSSDDESDAQKTDMEKGERPSMCSKESYVVQHPDEKAQEKGSAHNQFKNDIDHFNRMHLRGHSYAYRSSTVTYGGPNGACYTSSTFKRTGTDGTVLEETKEDDATTGKATHKISCGIRDKMRYLALRKLGRGLLNNTCLNEILNSAAAMQTRYASSAWQYILKLQEIFSGSPDYEVGIRTFVQLWREPSNGNRTLAEIFPQLHRLARVPRISIAEAHVVDNLGVLVRWNISFLSYVNAELLQKMASALEVLRFSSGDDIIRWK